MQFEEAMQYLRMGRRIFRKSEPNKGSLCGTPEKVKGSFYLTIYDVMALDWAECKENQTPGEIDEDE